jgi:hypothetical protein
VILFCNVRQCAPQCAAVRQKCGSVRQRVAVCGSAAVRQCVCGIVRQCGSVRQCARGCHAAVRGAVCGGVWQCAGLCVVVWVNTFVHNIYWDALIGAAGISPIFITHEYYL